MTDYGPSITLAKLYERVSKRGATYLVGRLGLASIVLLKTDEVSETGQPIWLLKVSEAPAKAKPEAQKRPTVPASDWQAPLEPAETRGEGRAPPPARDGEIPF